MTLINDVVCRKCGQNCFDASTRGAYLSRVNPKGVDGIWECKPTCEHLHGDQDDALLGALFDNEEIKGGGR